METQEAERIRAAEKLLMGLGKDLLETGDNLRRFGEMVTMGVTVDMCKGDVLAALGVTFNYAGIYADSVRTIVNRYKFEFEKKPLPPMTEDEAEGLMALFG